MKKIDTNNAPKALGPYSQAIFTWNTLYCSGQIWLVPKTNNIVAWWIKAETNQVCKNIWEILKEAGLNYKNVVKTTILLDDINDFQIVNEIYSKYFSHKPARSTFEISKLPLWVKIEIEVIAIKE